MIAALSLLGSSLASSSSAQPPQATDNAVAAGPANAGGSDFGQMLANSATNAIHALKAGEATSIAGLQGKATVQQVVESVVSADQSLHTAVAIRDKIVTAYQALAQMAI